MNDWPWSLEQQLQQQRVGVPTTPVGQSGSTLYSGSSAVAVSTSVSPTSNVGGGGGFAVVPSSFSSGGIAVTVPGGALASLGSPGVMPVVATATGPVNMSSVSTAGSVGGSYGGGGTAGVLSTPGVSGSQVTVGSFAGASNVTSLAAAGVPGSLGGMPAGLVMGAGQVGQHQHAAPHHASVRLDKFSADDAEDIAAFDRWWRKLEICAAVNGWDPQRQLLELQLNLVGRAERMFELIPPGERSNIVQARLSLRQRLAPPEMAGLLARKFHNLWQMESESIDSFALKMEAAFKDSYGRVGTMSDQAADALLLNHFTQHILPKYVEKIALAADYRSAVMLARTEEARLAEVGELHRLRLGTSGKMHNLPKTEVNLSSDKIPDRVAHQDGTGNPSESGKSGWQSKAKCYSCGGFGHIARQCPRSTPRSSHGSFAQKGHVQTVSNDESASQSNLDSPEDELALMRQRVSALELQVMQKRLEQARQTPSVNQLTGQSTAPLHYAKVQINGIEVEGMVDSGSTATIVSFELLKDIQANLTEQFKLQLPNTTLYSFGGQPVKTAAQVMATISFNGSSIEVPIFVQRPGESNRQCLLGNNVIIPLGIVSFQKDDASRMVDSSPSKAEASPGESDDQVAYQQLVLDRDVHLPASSSRVVEVPMETATQPSSVLVSLDGSDLITGEDVVVQPDSGGTVHIAVRNDSALPQYLAKGTVIGKAEVCEVSHTHVLETSEEAPTCSPCGDDRAQKLLESLTIGDELQESERRQLEDLALRYHDVFALDEVDVQTVVWPETRHKVDTGDSGPIKQHPRRVPYALRPRVKQLSGVT